MTYLGRDDIGSEHTVWVFKNGLSLPARFVFWLSSYLYIHLFTLHMMEQDHVNCKYMRRKKEK